MFISDVFCHNLRNFLMLDDAYHSTSLFIHNQAVVLDLRLRHVRNYFWFSAIFPAIIAASSTLALAQTPSICSKSIRTQQAVFSQTLSLGSALCLRFTLFTLASCKAKLPHDLQMLL